MQRVFLIVLDSFGVGALPDAAAFGDQGAHTLDHMAAAAGPLDVPNLTALGLGSIAGVHSLAAVPRPGACFARLAERSPGKDSSTGHWELMGLVLERPFPTYPRGFPRELIAALIERAGLPGILGNEPASGTEILERLGGEHVATGLPIVYTSADSVLQVAAHEVHFGLERLYSVCEHARELTRAQGLGRVIARPFVDAAQGAGTRFTRTYNRRDWSLEPFGPTSLDRLQEFGVPTLGLGKIKELFAGCGIDAAVKTGDNAATLEATLKAAQRQKRGLVFVNLVDFDMLYGHRRDPHGYARALEAFDRWLPSLQAHLREGDLVLLTADHGNDPTFTATTDHTREYVPLLAFGPGLAAGRDLGTRSTFADVGATVEEAFGLGPAGPGRSFLPDLMSG
jgi:phosphopentomutase